MFLKRRIRIFISHTPTFQRPVVPFLSVFDQIIAREDNWFPRYQYMKNKNYYSTFQENLVFSCFCFFFLLKTSCKKITYITHKVSNLIRVESNDLAVVV